MENLQFGKKQGYYLVLRYGNGQEHILCSFSTIKEMDSFTINFVGKNDIVNYFGLSYDVSFDLFIYGGHTDRIEQVRYSFDKYNVDVVKKLYYDFLIKNRQFISESLVRFVKKGIVVDSRISEEDLKSIFRAYYSGSDYKKVRDTYFKLVGYGIIERRFSNEISQKSIFKESIKIKPYTSNDFLNEAITRDNEDDIFKYFDLDDMSVETINYVTRSGRRR